MRLGGGQWRCDVKYRERVQAERERQRLDLPRPERVKKPKPEPTKCLCGCGHFVKLGNKYLHGHHRRGVRPVFEAPREARAGERCEWRQVVYPGGVAETGRHAGRRWPLAGRCDRPVAFAGAKFCLTHLEVRPGTVEAEVVPVTVRCGRCGFTEEITAGQAAEVFRGHRCSRDVPAGQTSHGKVAA